MIDFKKFNSVISLTSYFNSNEKCKQAIIESRWSDGDVVCPYCGGHHCVTRKDGKFRCKWLFNGFRREENPNVQELLNDTALLEEALNKGLKKGYITTKQFAGFSGLTLYSARKQLDAWTQGENPKLMKSRMGQTDIYTAT